MPSPIRAPRGKQLTCKNWLIEAAYRMLQNNLDPEVAFDPDNLIVYGGRGRAAPLIRILVRRGCVPHGSVFRHCSRRNSRVPIFRGALQPIKQPVIASTSNAGVKTSLWSATRCLDLT